MTKQKKKPQKTTTEKKKERKIPERCSLRSWVTTGASEDAIGNTLNVAIKAAVFRWDCLNL